MNCPACQEQEVEMARLEQGLLFCPACGVDWREMAEALLMPRHLFNQALEAAGLDDLAKAEQLLLLSAYLDARQAATWVVLGKVLGQRGRHLEAIKAWKKALRCQEGEPAAQAGIAWARRALRASQEQGG